MDSRGSLPFYAMLGFVPAIVLAVNAPLLFAFSAGLAFVGWLLVRLDVLEAYRMEPESATGSRDPLEALQTAYATEEIDEREFERRLDRIVESTDAAERRSESTGSDSTPQRDLERA
ncbi:hypothetical protein [Natrononativus amylolyticus]|uniref:hypothetical protein n=1 Tax=Natrononativus amylolyticus TaxID=2963434 RepID=UPI0020CF7645|nr:hypothetical protein [Natrononativus amylolyticus]